VSIIRNWGSLSQTRPDRHNNAVLKLITGPLDEPISLSEAKRHLRIDYSADDAVIQLLITGCRQSLERWLRRGLLTQTWDLSLDWGPAWVEAPYAPLQSVTGIWVRGLDSSEVAVAGTTYYVNLAASMVALNPGTVWPAHLSPMGFRMRYVVGYGDTSDDVPAAIRLELLTMIALAFEDRTSLGVPDTSKRSLQPYRVVGAGIRMAKGIEPPELLA
jgi:uncharacterized phiE125 gp8 family phage protein